MNNRDPFNLRQSSPLAILRSSARLASRTATNLQNQIQRGYDRLNLPDTFPDQLAAGGMASSSTSNWAPAPRARAQTLGTSTVTDKLNRTFLETERSHELPMYKDKPYNYAASSRRGPFLRRSRIIILVVALTVIGVYFSGVFSRSAPVVEEPQIPVPNQAPEAAHYPVDDSVPKIKQVEEQKAGGLLGGALPGILGGGKKPSQPKAVDWLARREKVKDAFKSSWKAYEDHAWGYDQYKPVSEVGEQMFPKGLGWIIVDALDTMMIMGLNKQIAHAKEWISSALDWNQDHDVNSFEVTIRMIGGLLSAHYLQQEISGQQSSDTVLADDDLFLEKAVDLADRVLSAYDSKSGIPYASVNLGTRQGIPSHDDDGASSTAEAATVQLEMKYLSNLTGEKNYWDKAEKIMQVIDDNGAQDGLVPIFIYAETGSFRGQNIRLGSRGDSYYEYLIKQYLQTNKQEPIYKEMWDQALSGVKKHLITYSKHANLTILGERPNGLAEGIYPKMDHLVCFMPGTIALATTEGMPIDEARTKIPGWGPQHEENMELAKQLMATCWGMYKVTATGLSPEIAHFKVHNPAIPFDSNFRPRADPFVDTESTNWHMDYEIHSADFHNLQRPETVESLFYMWRILGDETYRNWGWEMFQSFLEHTIVKGKGSFTSINNVDKIPPPLRDNMESFWLAETLKYMYLLFGPNDILPLDRIVFNTEAHPFPKFDLGRLFSTGWKRAPRDANGNLLSKPKTSATSTSTQV